MVSRHGGTKVPRNSGRRGTGKDKTTRGQRKGFKRKLGRNMEGGTFWVAQEREKEEADEEINQVSFGKRKRAPCEECRQAKKSGIKNGAIRYQKICWKVREGRDCCAQRENNNKLQTGKRGGYG